MPFKNEKQMKKPLVRDTVLSGPAGGDLDPGFSKPSVQRIVYASSINRTA